MLHITCIYLVNMDSGQSISITELTNATDTLDSLSGFEAAQKRQEDCDLSTENTKSLFKPWRIFINHLDSYHGKILTAVRIIYNKKFIYVYIHIYLFIYLYNILGLCKKFVSSKIKNKILTKTKKNCH